MFPLCNDKISNSCLNRGSSGSPNDLRVHQILLLKGLHHRYHRRSSHVLIQCFLVVVTKFLVKIIRVHSLQRIDLPLKNDILYHAVIHFRDRFVQLITVDVWLIGLDIFVAILKEL